MTHSFFSFTRMFMSVPFPYPCAFCTTTSLTLACFAYFFEVPRGPPPRAPGRGPPPGPQARNGGVLPGTTPARGPSGEGSLHTRGPAANDQSPGFLGRSSNLTLARGSPRGPSARGTPPRGPPPRGPPRGPPPKGLSPPGSPQHVSPNSSSMESEGTTRDGSLVNSPSSRPPLRDGGAAKRATSERTFTSWISSACVAQFITYGIRRDPKGQFSG